MRQSNTKWSSWFLLMLALTLCGPALAATAPPPQSIVIINQPDPWETVIIRGGRWDNGDRLWDVANSVVNVPWTTPGDPGYTSYAAVAGTLGSGADVRMLCAIRPSLASTTSKNDVFARQDAIRALVGAYNAYWGTTLAWARATGRAVNNNGDIRVEGTFTFADGGTEKYLINPLITVNAIAVTGSLRVGDGVARNVPCKG